MAPPTPNLLATSYDGNLLVGAQWLPIPGTNQFTITVYQGLTVLGTASALGTTGSVKLTAPITSKTAQVAVAALSGGEQGPNSNLLLVIVDVVADIEAAYDGRQVDVSWTLPASVVNAAQASVLDAAGDLLAEEGFQGSNGVLKPSAPLAAGATLQLSAAFGGSIGPPVSISLVTVPSATAGVIYEPAAALSVSVLLVGPQPPGLLASATLYANGQPFASHNAPGTLVAIPLTAALDPATTWTVRPTWLGAGASGPQGPPVDVLVAAPTLRSVNLEGAVTLAWENLPGPPYPTGGQVLLSAAGQTTVAAVISGADGGTFTPKPSLAAGVVYAATVAALRGPAQGPASAPVSLPNVQTAVESTSYDGRTLTVTWSGADPAGTTGCRVELLEGAAVVAEQAATAGLSVLAVALSPTTAYSARLRWLADRGSGPAAASAPVIAATAGVAAIALNATTVAVTVAEPGSAPGVVRYVAQLFQGERLLASSSPVAQLVSASNTDTDGTAPVAAIAFAVAGVQGLTVRVQALGAAAGPSAAGPLGPPAVLVAEGPEIESANVDRGSLDLRWRAPAAPAGSITSTTIVLTPSQGTAATFANLPGTSATVALAEGFLDPKLTYTVTAVANGPLGASLPGPGAPLLSGAPEVTRASWDGAQAQATWAWAQGASGASLATAYRLELFADGVRRGRAIVDGLAAALRPDGPLEVTAQIQLAVTPLAPGTEFAGMLGPALLSAAPELEGSTASADGHLTLTWAAAPGAVTGYEAVLSLPGVPDTVTALAAATSPQTIALPAAWTAHQLVTGRVALRATGAGLTGPASTPLAVLRTAPILEEASFDGSSLCVRWSPPLGEIEGYQLIASSTDKTESVTVRGTSAKLALTPGSVAWATGVVARLGAAASPGTPVVGTAGCPLVIAGPAVGARSYDGASLKVAVTAPNAPSPAATGYRLELLRGATVVQRADLQAPAQGQSLALAVESPADPAASYTVRVRARANQALGPSASAPVILAAPRVVHAQAGDAVIVNVLPGPLPPSGLTLQACLILDGQEGTPVAVDGQGLATFPLPAAGSTCALAARGTYEGVTGPWSAPVAVPYSPPTILAARYEEGELLLAWEGNVTSTYLVTVVAGGRDIARTQVRGLATSVRFDVPTPTAAAHVVVRELSGVAVGLPQTLPLLTTGAGATAATAEDQSSVTVSWTAPSAGPTPTGFVPVLVYEGVVQELTPVAADQSSAPIPLAGVPAGASVGVRVQAGAALGPVGNLAPVVLGGPTGVALRWAAGELSGTWTAPEDPRIDGALVTLIVAGQHDASTRVFGTAWQAPLAAGVEGATVTVAAAAGAGTGAPTAPVVAIVDAPTVTKLDWDGGALSVDWTAVTQPAVVDRYLVSVCDDDAVLAQRSVAASPASLPLLEARATWQVTVAALAPGSTGPVSVGAAVPVAAPTPSQVVIDPTTGIATVSWSGPSAGVYLLQAYLDGEPVGAPVQSSTTSAALGAAPGVGQDLSVAVSGATTSGALTLVGPYGPRLRVPTIAPNVREVSFDGLSVLVAWDGVVGASGYTVSVVTSALGAAVATGTAMAGARSLRLAVPLTDLTHEYSVVVQAQHGLSVGIGASAPLFTPGLFVQSSGGSPRVVRSSTLAIAASQTVAYLPDIGTLTGLPIAPVQGGATNAPFTLAANTDAASSATLPYTLTIGNGALSFDAGRSTLAATYASLLIEAETHGATPQGIFVIQQAISRLMPQSFEETLYYAYGLSATRGCVDLRPGTILRVAAGGFNLTAVGSAPPWSSGYAGGEIADFAVGDYLDSDPTQPWLVGFDAFMGWLTANGVLSVPAPQATGGGTVPDVVQSGGADAADLFFPAFRQPYHRLLIPSHLQAATPPAISRTNQQFTIASAASWAQINANPTGSGGGVSLAYLRGRAVLRLCIRVEVEGAEHVVPLGSTVGNLLDGLGRRPPSTARPIEGLRLERALGPVVLDPGGGYDAGASSQVHLDWNGLVTWGRGRDALSLPLLHGDRLSLGEQT